jgi:hypothetical protein
MLLKHIFSAGKQLIGRLNAFEKFFYKVCLFVKDIKTVSHEYYVMLELLIKNSTNIKNWSFILRRRQWADEMSNDKMSKFKV